MSYQNTTPETCNTIWILGENLRVHETYPLAKQYLHKYCTAKVIRARNERTNERTNKQACSFVQKLGTYCARTSINIRHIRFLGYSRPLLLRQVISLRARLRVGIKRRGIGTRERSAEPRAIEREESIGRRAETKLNNIDGQRKLKAKLAYK